MGENSVLYIGYSSAFYASVPYCLIHEWSCHYNMGKISFVSDGIILPRPIVSFRTIVVGKLEIVLFQSCHIDLQKGQSPGTCFPACI